MQAEDPPKSLNRQEKTQLNTCWVGLPKIEVSTKPIVPQNLFVIPNNKVMFMEQIFQDIRKHMFKITYTLRLSQLLKITLDFKRHMWQKLKLEKPNISTKMIP
jgi:hypothetical protein